VGFQFGFKASQKSDCREVVVDQPRRWGGKDGGLAFVRHRCFVPRIVESKGGRRWIALYSWDIPWASSTGGDTRFLPVGVKRCLISDKHPWNNVKALRSTNRSSKRPICDPDFALFLVCVMMLLTRDVVVLCKSRERKVIGISLVTFSGKQESSYDFGEDNFLLLLRGIVSCVHVVCRRRPWIREIHEEDPVEEEEFGCKTNLLRAMFIMLSVISTLSPRMCSISFKALMRLKYALNSAILIRFHLSGYGFWRTNFLKSSMLLTSHCREGEKLD